MQTVIITFPITFSLTVNVITDTINMHQLIFFIKNLDVAFSHYLHCFAEGNFHTLDMTDLMTLSDSEMLIKGLKVVKIGIQKG